jgi:hypothetical protein
MRRLELDYDPLSGTTEFLEFQDDKMRVVRAQDVSLILDQAKVRANDEDYTRRGIKKDEWHYARVPNIVLEEMKAKHHVDWYDPNDKGHKRFFAVLNAHYPAFKTTAWNHG